jgi:DNA-binding NtrC family response regulator
MDDRKKVLVVDDESSVRESLKLILNRFYDVEVADSGNTALDLLKYQVEEASQSSELPDVVLLDLVMPGMDGLGLLEKLQTEYPQVPVIMLTATTSVKTAVQAMKIGAVDYLNKPYDVDELLNLINETLEEGAVGRESPSAVMTIKHVRPELPKIEANFGTMVGEHPLMAELFSKIDTVAERDTTVLITGESGTGKELIAKEIHDRSPRKDGPFVAINCAAIPETLIESELFGHEKGAYTHAVEKREGHFSFANNGTLFLDEIGELSLTVQVKILRFLQEQEFYRVGASKPTKVSVRVIAATNKNLETAIKDGAFRQDLFYRINVVALDVPPLRDRKEDIDSLVQYFLKRFQPIYGNREISFTEQAKQVLSKYSWPGNVRELENVLESVLALSSKSVIEADDLPNRIRNENGAASLGHDVLAGITPFEDAERAFESDLILKALKKTDFVQTKAAELLGISRRILKYKMDKLGISEEMSESKTN